MGADLKWLIGISVSVAVSFVIALIGILRSFAAAIKQVDALLKRINYTRDEIGERTRVINKRLDQILVMLLKDK